MYYYTTQAVARANGGASTVTQPQSGSLHHTSESLISSSHATSDCHWHHRLAGMASTSKQQQSAKCYGNEGSRLQRKSGQEFLQQLSPVRGSTALDLGCGTGYLAAQLCECVGPEGKVVAVDPDEERLKIAREKYVRDNIDYVSGNDKIVSRGSVRSCVRQFRHPLGA